VKGQISIQDSIQISTADGVRIVGTLHAPRERPRATVQIHGGFGVKRQLYRHFAAFLAARGYAVLTFDYRGTGSSRPTTLRGFRARLRDWGQRDLPAALDWMAARYPNLPRYVVGHSMGGQLTGLMHNHDLLDGLVLVAVASGHYRTFPVPFMLYRAFMLYLFLPLVIRLFGYAPARFVTPGEDLPAGVVREWIEWTRHAGYIGRSVGTSPARGFHYREVKAPIRAFACDDDPLATPANSRRFLGEYYRKAPRELSTLRAADAAGGRIGHLGYFRKQRADSHWVLAADWLDARLAKSTLSAVSAA
jgi:predicted alpha/beta hydrolase